MFCNKLCRKRKRRDAMALAKRFICSITGIDSLGGFHPSLDAILKGLRYAAPPIMALLFILDDEVAKLSPHARAIRDFILVVAASSVEELLFYRAVVQGALANIFLRGTDLVTNAQGIASLTRVLPPFVPFAQAFAAVIIAALTGSLYYVAASPKASKDTARYLVVELVLRGLVSQLNFDLFC
ncbi:hypothetical protein UlMin_039363 [Ulmus minor]